MAESPLDLNELRSRVLAGQPYTREELIAALAALRNLRDAAGEKAVAKRIAKNAAATPMSDEDLDASLAQLGLNI